MRPDGAATTGTLVRWGTPILRVRWVLVTDLDARPTVSVVVPVRNEIDRISVVIDNAAAQSVRPDEVVVVDGGSTDGTWELLAERARTENGWLVVVRNDKRIIPVALNLGIATAHGELIARMDAHADYPYDYLERLTDLLAARPDVTGAGSAMTTAGRGAWGKAIAAVLSRKIGLGGARHRVGGHGGPIEHVFTGCYRRAALDAAGGYDERLVANEDFEMDVRIRAAGGTLWLHPEARSTWYVRNGPGGTARQMYRYGLYKARTLWLHPSSLRARQLAPPGLVVTLVVLAALIPVIGWYPVAAVAVSYLLACGIAGVRAARADGASAWRVAIVPPLVHLSWGTGVLLGAVRFFGARTAVARRGTAVPIPHGDRSRS